MIYACFILICVPIKMDFVKMLNAQIWWLKNNVTLYIKILSVQVGLTYFNSVTGFIINVLIKWIKI